MFHSILSSEGILLFKDNFLPSYISWAEEEETESLYKEVFPPDERYSESGLMDAQTPDKSKDALEEQEVTDLDNLELDNSGTAGQGSQLDQNKSLSSTWEQSWWLLKIIYIIVGGGELIINFLKVCPPHTLPHYCDHNDSVTNGLTNGHNGS